MREADLIPIEEYAALEKEFKEQVERDSREFGIGIEYVPNIVPRSKVDYVLIAKEPSTGTSGKDVPNQPQIARNFAWSVEDFILHYCVRNYLCPDGETYHITDLAKGGMTTSDAHSHGPRIHKRWYPLLKKELRLLAKPEGTRVIAVGKVAAEFLGTKDPCRSVGRVLHYSKQAGAHRTKGIKPWCEEFPVFCRRFDKDDLARCVDEVLRDADMDSYIGKMPEGKVGFNLTESRMKLIFLYKKCFKALRKDDRLLLDL